MQKISKILLEIFIPFREIFNFFSKDKLFKVGLLIIPVIFFLNAYVFQLSYGKYYLSTIDPEYFHLFNGIAIGGGNPDVGYTAHPGTPLQFLIAFSSRVVHFFQGDDYYLNDFLSQPEKYLHAASLFQILIITLMLFFGAKYIYRTSGLRTASIFFQLIPFGNAALFSLVGRLMPEPLMILPFLMIFILTIKYIFSDEVGYETNYEPLIWGIIVGFGIACKLSFAPLALLPLILYRLPIKGKLYYIVYLIMAFCIFAYPVILNFEEFMDWISGMFTHSGMHGKGESKFIEWSTFIPNLEFLFGQDKLFFFILPASLIVAGISFFKDALVNRMRCLKISRSILAINVIIFLTLFLTLKHFAFHYFMPFYTIKIFLLILSLMMLRELKIVANAKWTSAIVVLFFFTGIISIVMVEKKEIGEVMARQFQRTIELERKSQIVKNLTPDDTPLIISSPYYGAPYKSFAFHNGFLMSYEQKSYFKKSLEEMYPNTFFHETWSEFFFQWNNFVGFDYILSRGSRNVIVYIGPGVGENLKDIENRLYSYIDQKSINKEILYYDKATKEKLIKYTIDPSVKLKALTKEDLINKYIKNIKSSDEWLDKVKKKAAKKGIPLDSMLYLEAEWLLDNK